MANTKKVLKKIAKPVKGKVKLPKVKLNLKPLKVKTKPLQAKTKRKQTSASNNFTKFNKFNKFNKKNKFTKFSKFSKKQIVIFSVITVACIVIFVLMYIYTYMSNNPKFNIANIEVAGNQNYTSEDIIVASKILLGENIFKISLKDIQSNILSLPYVETVTFKRNLPDTLQITITEREYEYMAYAKDSGEYIKLSSDGVILEIIDVSDVNNISALSNLTILFGINFDDKIVPGNSITELEKEKIMLWENVKRIYSENNINAKISHVEFKGNNIILTLEDKLQVILSNMDLEYSIVFMKTIMQEIDGKSGVLDMTLENPVFSAK